MLFNSYTFWIFFAIVFVLYRGLRHRSQNRMLLAASYIFYGAWDWRFLSLIWLSTCIDYIVALRLDRCAKIGCSNRQRLCWLTVSLASNLGILGFFKYFGFFANELNDLLAWLGLGANLPSLNIVLPVGISFYTFQTMSYTIDVFRKEIKPTRSFEDFALYVAFFPQLVAGPIERSTHLMPQILSERTPRSGDFTAGLYLVTLGMFKKIVIADNMAEIANGVFQQPPSQLSGLDCILGIYAFAFQIYGDFSGYSAIARGISRWLGFDIMVNFNLPYFAKSPRDFWHRWHISLSTWLRDYLYIPLGGSRFGTLVTYRNLLITMILGGLWHGAGWTFIFWGLLHGTFLCVDRLVASNLNRSATTRPSLWRDIGKTLVTFHLVCLGWLFFRAENASQAFSMLSAMLTDIRVTDFSRFAAATVAFYATPLIFYELWLLVHSDLDRLIRVQWPIRAMAYSYAYVMLLFFQPVVTHEFIYFQF